MSNTKALMRSGYIPTLASNDDEGLQGYLAEIKRFPMLSAEEESSLAYQWRDQGDSQAAHKLVTSHLRLVAKIAAGFRGYGLPFSELIAEGNIGLMQAVKKFEPERGFRLATYAMWWIKASIQEYVLHSWSLVKIGTTTSQKKLFFNLRKAKNKIKAWHDGDLNHEELRMIADDLSVSEDEVLQMNRRMSHGGDQSLNVRVGEDSNQEWQDLISDDKESTNQEQMVVDANEATHRHELLYQALTKLTDREQDIITRRRLNEKNETLEELSQEYGISRERVRQIEEKAFEKLQAGVLNLVAEQQQQNKKSLSDFRRQQKTRAAHAAYA